MPRLAALLVACLGLTSALTAPKKVGVRQLRSKPEFAPKALEVRGGGMGDKTQYVKVSTAIYGIYALQFFFIGKFVASNILVWQSADTSAPRTLLEKAGGVSICF